MIEGKRVSIVKPNIDTPFHVDFNWWKKNERDWHVYLRTLLCAEHQQAFADVEEGQMIDWVDPTTAEVKPGEGIQNALMPHCARQPEFLTQQTALVEAVFRLFEAGLVWGQESYKFGSDSYAPNLGKPTFDLQLGGTVNPYLRLGGEWNVWWYNYQDDEGYDVTESLHYVGAVARVYPVTSLGLFAKGGAGLGITSASVDYGSSTSETGFRLERRGRVRDQGLPGAVHHPAGRVVLHELPEAR